MTPLEYLMSVYQDPAVEIDHRIEAAKAAAPYVHPRLSQVAVQATADLRHLTDEQVEAEIVALLADPHLQSLVANRPMTLAADLSSRQTPQGRAGGARSSAGAPDCPTAAPRAVVRAG